MPLGRLADLVLLIGQGRKIDWPFADVREQVRDEIGGDVRAGFLGSSALGLALACSASNSFPHIRAAPRRDPYRCSIIGNVLVGRRLLKIRGASLRDQNRADAVALPAEPGAVGGDASSPSLGDQPTTSKVGNLMRP